MKYRLLFALLFLSLFCNVLLAQEIEEGIEVYVEEENDDSNLRGTTNVPISCYYSSSGLVDLIFERDLGTSCITVRNLTYGDEDTYVHIGIGIKSFFLDNGGLYYIRIVTSSGRIFGALFYATIKNI